MTATPRDLQLSDGTIARVYHDVADGMLEIRHIEARDGIEYQIATYHCDDDKTDASIEHLCLRDK
jgi:hypothetical protein